MWADKVDEWIKENETKRGNPETSWHRNIKENMVVGLVFHIPTLFIPYFIFKRRRSPKYHPNIHNRTGYYKIDDSEAKKVLETCLDAEATKIADDEEVLFVVQDGANREGFTNQGWGIVYTSERVMYFLEKPAKVGSDAQSGTIALKDLGRPVVDGSFFWGGTDVTFGSRKNWDT